MLYGVGGTGVVPEAGTTVAPVAGTKILLRRSGVQGKLPTAGDAEYGELFINYHSGDPMLCFKDNSDNIVEIKPPRAIDGGGGEVPPDTGNVVGDLVWDGTHLRVWDGTTWLAVGPGSLAYVQKADMGTVTNTAGDGFDIPLVNNLQAGLMAPGDKNKLDNYPADPTASLVDLGYTAAVDKGTVTNTGGTNADIPVVGASAGLMTPGDKSKLDGYPASPDALALDLQAVTDNGSTTTNGATFGNGNIALNANGSAKFISYIESGSVANKGGGGNVLNFGEISAYSATAGSHLWRGWDAFSGSSNTLTSEIKADGSATFGAGNITLDAEGSADFKGRINVSQDNSAASLFRGSLSGAVKFQVAADGSASFGAGNITLNASGSATFAGEVTADTFKYSGSAPSPALAGKEINLVKTIELMAAKLAELGGVDIATLFVAEDPAPVTQPADPVDDADA